jgi:hypothetical protein
MKIQHTPSHWILVALVLAGLLLTLSEAHGQSGAAAVFEGRPALAGAQGGLGAQAGPAQGGIGVQGNDAAERSMQLNKPSQLDDMRHARRDGKDVVAAANTDMTLRQDVPSKDVAPTRDHSIAKDQRSAAKKAKRAAKRTIERAKYGSSPIDTAKQ